jgi:hypothetical protein
LYKFLQLSKLFSGSDEEPTRLPEFGYLVIKSPDCLSSANAIAVTIVDTRAYERFFVPLVNITSGDV